MKKIWKMIVCSLILVVLIFSQSVPIYAKEANDSFSNLLLNWFQSPFVHTVMQDQVEVIPGGQSIGIKLRASGVLVVGYYLVHRGKTAFSPGEQSSVHIGDVIVSVDGRKVSNVDDVARLIDTAGRNHQSLAVLYKRKGVASMARVRPAFDDENGVYRIGLYIRDSASGVGTLTFYAPTTHGFGALGHVIADADTGQAIDGRGQIVHAAVTSIDRGESGQPGEKRGLFVNDHKVLGLISHNTDFGVFGTMQHAPDHGYIDHLIRVAHPSEVHSGPAQILTVVSGQKVEAFAVTIVQVNHQDHADIKSMVIRVTDPSLLARTGGIVQGMSGSPIIQDGKLAGAVTHVFVSDPAQGYGVYAAWMLRNLSDVALANSHTERAEQAAVAAI